MKLDFLKNILLTNFGFEPTPDQDRAMEGLCRFVLESEQDSIYLLCGYAGTGKTSLMSAFVKTLNDFNIRTKLMAPTGRAAKVFSQYSRKKALTIHKSIYRQKYGLGSSFMLDRNLCSDTFFIVDEASMISQGGNDTAYFGSGRLLDDLVSYVFSGNNCRLILIGDTGQLPPVGSPLSPALDSQELECYGKTVYKSLLSNVVRQASDSGILFNATVLRNQVEHAAPGQIIKPRLSVSGFPDVENISGGELLEKLENSYDKVGLLDTLVVTRSNKNANIYNNGIRSRIFWREEEITVGDMIMVVKNNYFYTKDIENLDFIANGDIAEVVRVGRTQELYGFHFINIDLKFHDYDGLEISAKIIQESLQSQGPSLTETESLALYEAVLEDYQGMPKSEIYKQMRENEYFNALQVKFAYAVTCHKSQGGQWQNVFIDQGYLTDEMMDREYLRWLYTAITRATNKVYFVNFKPEFFENK